MCLNITSVFGFFSDILLPKQISDELRKYSVELQLASKLVLMSQNPTCTPPTEDECENFLILHIQVTVSTFLTGGGF